MTWSSVTRSLAVCAKAVMVSAVAAVRLYPGEAAVALTMLIRHVHSKKCAPMTKLFRRGNTHLRGNKCLSKDRGSRCLQTKTRIRTGIS